MMFSSPALFQREQKTRVNIRYALTVYSSYHLSTWGKKARLKDVFFMPMALYLGRRKQFPRRGLEELQSRHVSLACTSVASHYTSIDMASGTCPKKDSSTLFMYDDPVMVITTMSRRETKENSKH